MESLIQMCDSLFRNVIQCISVATEDYRNEMYSSDCDSIFPYKKSIENLNNVISRSRQVSSQVKSFSNSLKLQVEALNRVNKTYSSIFHPGDLGYESSTLMRIATENLENYITRLTDMNIRHKIIEPYEYLISKSQKLSQLRDEVKYSQSQYVACKGIYEREYQSKICDAEKLASLRAKYHSNELEFQRTQDKFVSSVTALVNECKFVDRTTVNLLRQYHSEFMDRCMFAIDSCCAACPDEYTPNIDISGVDADIEELLRGNISELLISL